MALKTHLLPTGCLPSGSSAKDHFQSRCGIQCDIESEVIDNEAEECMELDILNNEVQSESDLETARAESELTDSAPVEPALLAPQSPATNSQHLPTPITPRSTRPRNFPDYYMWSADIVKVEPSSVEEAMTTPKKDHWLEAMQREMVSLKENDV